MVFEICTNGHRCENGSVCVENPFDEGNFYCDCNEVVFNAAYEGLSCEHEATSYCSMDKLISKNSFCTNGGKCLAFADSDEAHWGCECPENYVGGHCQYVKGSKPDGWPYNKGGVNMAKNGSNTIAKGSSGGGIKGEFIALIVIICCAIVTGMGYIIYKKKVKSEQDVVSADELGNPLESPETVRVSSKDLVLDADGSGLKEDIEKKDRENFQISPEIADDPKNSMDDAEII